MTPQVIFERIAADGVRLVLTPRGTLKATGDQQAVNRWLPVIKEHKPGIVAVLQQREHVTVEPAPPTARPVYWEAADGRIIGPAVPELLARAGNGPSASFWIVTTYEGQLHWINADRLRSQRQFERQVEVYEVEPVRSC